jgi:hypothetical protein
MMQKGFYLIVRMMCHGNPSGRMVHCDTLEKAMTQAAKTILGTIRFAPLKCSFHDKSKTKFDGETLDKPLVFVAFLATQTMVVMGYDGSRRLRP